MQRALQVRGISSFEALKQNADAEGWTAILPLTQRQGLRPLLPPQTNRREIATAIFLFCLGFVLVAMMLHTTLRDPLHLHADMRSEKLLMLEELRGSAYSAAFGSSHVLNDFDPRSFDTALAGSSSAGPALHTHTLNLGVAGGSQTEQRVMALEFVRGLAPPPRNTTCLVMLELGAGANFQNLHLIHPRSINVYDWKTVRFVSHLTDGRMPLTQRAGRVGYALIAGLLHYTNVGMVSDQLLAPPIQQEQYAKQTEGDRRGQWELSPTAPLGARVRDMIEAEPSHPVLDRKDLLRGNSELIDELADASTVRNLSFVYFVLPNLGDLADAPLYPDHITTSGGRTVPILNMARPDLYPELYRSDLWYDEAHLNGRGATRLTPILVGQLKAWYAQHGAPSSCGG